MLLGKACAYTCSGRVSRQGCAVPRQRRFGPSGVLAPKSLGGCPHLLPTESHMNGAARPCENSTIDIANTANRLFFRTRHVLAPISGESFSAGLCRAKTTEAGAKITEICAKEGLCLSRLHSVYFFAQGMSLHLSQVEFLGRAVPCQDNGDLCQDNSGTCQDNGGTG